MNYLTVFFLIAITVLSGCSDKAEESAKNVREGNRLLYASRIAEAKETYLKATELNPNNEEAWYGLGLTWMNERKYNKAIEYFDKAIALKSNYADAYYNSGQAWFYMGELRKACKNWKKAHELGKANIEDKLKKCNNFVN